ncbi:hypothetical protein [Caulobacter rhizosphaerae]|uniref:hypothetical protein n=1 Tax=Caulobacter rhizosphaerae TaxID=2010972 RepID=UPI0013D821D3|nr:hypothetical protein [Caulobacter rhizosphaerae]GGL48467.1 hypothetical protein GCM10010983_52270 [Caulobacter rhizosphaerae]
MSYVTVDLPPGVYANGTPYSGKGRFINANLWRWYSGEQRPVGGWVLHTEATVSGKARAIIAWKSNTNTAWAGIGTHSGLYSMSKSGHVADITPVGYQGGRADASLGGGYGSLAYGTGVYGRARASTSDVIDATVWSLDTWGQNLVGCTASDQKIYEWPPGSASPAARITNSPEARAIVVTADRIIMALGAGNPRRVAWCDRENNTVWTSTAINYAGDFELQTVGRLMCGRRITGGTLLFTDVDVWLASFLGQPLVYGFTRVGSGCGIISQSAAVVTDSQAEWMSTNGFWSYNGFVSPLECDVHDLVFSDINLLQASKIHAVHISAFGEIWWFYPSAGSDEIDRYVSRNYRENHWSVGELTRLAATDRGVYRFPVMVDDVGRIWDHENGLNHGGARPFAETGPIEIGQGDNVFCVREIIPDERTLGQVEVSFTGRFYPNGPATAYGPYSLSQRTDCRLTARQVVVRYTADDGVDFRVGAFRFEGVAGGLR